MRTIKKIGITTYWTTPVNYGQVLQGYALQSILREKGFEPFIVRYTMGEEACNKSFFSRCIDFIKNGMNFRKFIKRFYYKTERDVDRRFEDFKCEYMSYSENSYPSFASLIDEYPQADIYITGSDQVWGKYGSVNKKKIFLLEFLPPHIPRIAYAASFGRKMLENDEKRLFQSALKKFKSISVREQFGIDICTGLKIDNVKWVVDPTVLLSKEDWIKKLKLKKEERVQTKTALVYLMQDEYATSIGHKVIKLLKHEGYEVRYVSSAYYIDKHSNYDPTLEQWLSAILSVDLMVTSSFHGTLFALIFNTAFIALGNKSGIEEEQNSRLFSLLNEVGLSERMINTFNRDKICNLITSEINWKKVNRTFFYRRKESLDFLFKALEVI